MTAIKPITLFSFGYWGWGNATQPMVDAMDTVERSRGFDPPLFVDIRISRGGRAEGFKGTAFEETVGHDRYVWMAGLGNRAIQTGIGRIDIKDPSAAESFLVLAAENAHRLRRVIFFCSCQWPNWGGGNCHRVTVASLLLKAAARRDLAAEIVEWPGGKPKTVTVALSPAAFRKAQTAAAIPIGHPPEIELLGLPWGSIAVLRAGADQSRHLVGPAHCRGGRWFLPKLTDELGSEVPPRLGLQTGVKWRKRWAFEPSTTRRHLINRTVTKR
jgi:hypothetical protein